MGLLGRRLHFKKRCRDGVTHLCIPCMSCLAWSLSSLHLLTFWGNVFHTCLCKFSLYNSTVTEEVAMPGYPGVVCMCAYVHFPARTLALTCDPWREGRVLKYFTTLYIKVDGQAFIEHSIYVTTS